MNAVDSFLQKSQNDAQDFEENTRHDTVKTEENVEDDMEVDENVDNEEQYEPVPLPKDDCHNRTTMFFNKYGEDTDIPSIANRLADAIVHFEIKNSIQLDEEDDFLIDNEIVTEEQFLHSNKEQTGTDNNDIEMEMEWDISPLSKELETELVNDLDFYNRLSEEQANILSMKARNLAKRIQEKVCVAPGEHGSFKNWEEDIYLEEKCFPEKFPFGQGGYLSSTIDDPESSMGFANYCKNQLLSCDPRFRNDDSYVFFLLLVKELILLKRCITTFYRQATRLSNLSRDDILHSDQSDITRYNRGYQVFKNVRGTAMYYEESKKNLFAILRQHGCPTLFLTLNSNEFDWPGLLKEILETELRRKVTDDEIDALSNAEKNKIIARNVVQSTLHFQRRIEKMYALMEKDFFVTDEHKYHVSMYFYRVEFQQRGAPHVHSLLWLKNELNEDAPSFWIQENTNQDADVEYLKQVEKFADNIMTTNPDDITCKEHEQNPEDSITCPECSDLLERVKKYQDHCHTFTCEKKNKTMTIKPEEGHGRLDGSVTKEALENIKVCRFNFPRFPSDETKVIVGIPKDED